MTCPECKGKKTCIGFLAKTDTCGPSEWTCTRCSGTGEVPDEQAIWIEEGLRLRCERVSRHESLLEAHQRTGFSTVEICAMERGMRDPAPLRQPAQA